MIGGCHAPAAGAPNPAGITIALAGNPNVGKSTIFNTLSGLRTLTTNYPGATVEVSAARARMGDQVFTLLDLPGVYGVTGSSEDQRAAWHALLTARPDAVMAIVDATNLARNLYLVLQLIDLGLPVVVALNLMDETERAGIRIDVARLEELLGVPVVPTVATAGCGLGIATAAALRVVGAPPAVLYRYSRPLEEEISRLSGIVDGQGPAASRGTALLLLEGGEVAALLAPGHAWPDGWIDHAQAAAGRLAGRTGEPSALTIAKERHAIAERIARQVTVTPGELRGRHAWRVATRPTTGLPLLALVLAVIFAGLFWGGGHLAGLIDAGWARYASPLIRGSITWLFGAGIATRTLLWGLDAGLNAVLSIGVPYVLTFYTLLALLEDSGYLNAAAVLLDRTLGRCGLSGRAAIPLVAGAGCNVPAIIGLRVLRTDRERLIAGTLIALVPCSARTAVIFGAVARFLGWPWALALYVVVSAVIFGAGWGLNRFMPGRAPDLLMEIFPFRMPTLRTVFRKTWGRVHEFIFVAVPIVLAGSVVLGGLYETGWIRWFARPLAPAVEGWLGLPAVAGLTLVFAVLRKELALQLLVALAITQYGAGADNLLSFMTKTQLFTYALVNTLYVPCVATIAVLAKALGWRRATLISAGTIALAVTLGGLVSRVLLVL